MKDFIAIYGGSFNLPTTTHLEVAKAVRDKIKPSKVWCQVSPQNPHKKKAGMAAFEDRVAMTKLNIGDEAGIEVSEIEKSISEKIGTTQSADILREMLKTYPDTRFAWVIGADNFATFHTWDGYEFILENFPVIVVPRKGFTEAALDSVAAHHPLSQRIDDPLDLRHKTGWHLLDFPEDEISATHERQMFREGVQPTSVRPEVFHYARSNNLFAEAVP